MRRKLGVIVSVFMIIAAIFTIVDTPIGWWERFISRNGTGGSAPTVQVASTPLGVTPSSTPAIAPSFTPTAAPSFTPTAALSLDQMLEAAKSGTTFDGQDRALRKVAEIAVSRGEYSVAIEAASDSASYDAESETLTFVARRAVEEGLFKYALEAAGEITKSEDHDRTKLEVLCAIKVAYFERLSLVGDPLYSTPRAIPSLYQMLEAAKSARTYDGQDRALRKVAEIAVSRGEYSVAIEAASASASYDAESETLTFVARCAVEEGLFDYALQAADEIPTYSDNDRMKVEVLNAVKVAESEPFSSIGDPPSTSCR